MVIAVFSLFAPLAFSAEDVNDSDDMLLRSLEQPSVDISEPLSQTEMTAVTTLEQAFEIADQSNREIEQAAIAVRQAEAAVREEQASYRPAVAVSADGSYSVPVTSSGNDSASLDGGIDLSYTLLDFGRREAAVNIASAELEVSRLELQVVQQTVRLDIATQYYDLQNAAEAVRIGQAAIANSEQNLRDTQLREQAGTGTRYDTLQAQTQLADDQVTLLSAQNDQAIAQRSLAQLLGIGDSVEALSVEAIAQRPVWPLSLEETLAQAYQTRAELSQQRLEQTIQQNTARLASAELSPELSLSTGYDFSNSSVDTSDSTYSWADGANISLDLSWTLYDGGAATAQVEQANAAAEIAVSELANQQDQIRLSVETAYLSVQSATEQIAAAEVGVVSAEEGLSLAQLRFQSGVGIQLEVLEAQSDLTDAQSTLAQATTAYNQSIVELERAISGL